MAEDRLPLNRLRASSLTDEEKREYIARFYPELTKPAKMPTYTRPQDTRHFLERVTAPVVEFGSGLWGAAKGIPKIPGAMGNFLEEENRRAPNKLAAGVNLVTGATPANMLGRVLGAAGSSIKEGTESEVQRHASDADAGPLERMFRAGLASTVVGGGVANMVEKGAKGDYAGAVTEGLMNLGPGLLGKFARFGPVKNFTRGKVLEEAAALEKAKGSPVGRMVNELGGNKVSPEVTTQRAAKIAEEELQKLGARNYRGDVAPSLTEVAASPDHLKTSIKDRLKARNEELRMVDGRAATQGQIEGMRLKDELLTPFPEKFTPTESGTFAAPELKSRLADLKEKFQPGTKGYAKNVEPFERGAPQKGISAAESELPNRVSRIPLEDAQQWQLLMKNVAGDPDSVRALRSTFVYNRMGAGKSADDFAKNLRTTPPDTVYAVLGEDAAPTFRILDRIDELANRNQNMAPRGGQMVRGTRGLERLEVLDSALDEIGKSRGGQGTFGRFLTGTMGLPTHSRVMRLLPIITAQGSPQSVVRFWRAFDVFTRNGYAPAFIQTVNAIERRSREEEQKVNDNQD